MKVLVSENICIYAIGMSVCMYKYMQHLLSLQWCDDSVGIAHSLNDTFFVYTQRTITHIHKQLSYHFSNMHLRTCVLVDDTSLSDQLASVLTSLDSQLGLFS